MSQTPCWTGTLPDFRTRMQRRSGRRVTPCTKLVSRLICRCTALPFFHGALCRSHAANPCLQEVVCQCACTCAFPLGAVSWFLDRGCHWPVRNGGTTPNVYSGFLLELRFAAASVRQL